MTEFTAIAERYIAAFNETDPTARKERVAALFAGDATYTDPLADVAGHDGIDGFLDAAQQQLAGFTFRLAGDVDGHHRQARFRWVAGPAGVADEDAPVVGFDVIVLDGDGRIRSVHGFLDAVPA
ncbi:nuclear transport factor 2 family protein [Pseudonocardia sp. CA-107938]|uniref:nuclear transport factor 2 family protein n=1 Tax=Pseudonocardia sp. CA-107938 TaxID=3240021 RepID=UPI003D8FED12